MNKYRQKRIAECIENIDNFLIKEVKGELDLKKSHLAFLFVLVVVYLAVFSLHKRRAVPVELIKNGDFAYWSQGANRNPDGWLLGGAATGTVNEETFIVRTGKNSAKITVNSVGGLALYQDIEHFQQYKNGEVVFSCWVKADSSDSAYLGLHDGSIWVDSTNHSGSGQWEKLVVKGDISGNATKLRVHLWVRNNSAYFDGPSLLCIKSEYKSLLVLLIILIVISLSVIFHPYLQELNKFLNAFGTPENFFLCSAFFFGSLMVILVAPFQAPDEVAHFARAYQISELKIIPERDGNKLGGSLPISFKEAVKSSGNEIKQHPERKISYEKILSAFSIPLNADKRVFREFATASYPPVPYLPQALGIFFGRIFDLGPLALMYLGRFFNLIVWIGLSYLAIKITPIHKWTFFLLGLMPMSIFLAASLSCDALTNSILFFFIAFILYLAMDNKVNISNRHLCILFIISLCLSLLKTGYFVFTPLFFLIPTSRFSNKVKYYLFFGILLIASILIVTAWAYFAKASFIHGNGANPAEQINLIINSPGQYIKTLLRSVSHNGLFYLDSFVGILGYLDTRLPNILVYSYVFVLFLLSSGDNLKDVDIPFSRKILFLTVISFIVFPLLTIMYVVWTPVGNPIIEGVQGRYFIPISPLFFLLFYNNKIKFQVDKFKIVIVGYSIICLSVTLLTIQKRYYY